MSKELIGFTTSARRESQLSADTYLISIDLKSDNLGPLLEEQGRTIGMDRYKNRKEFRNDTILTW